MKLDGDLVLSQICVVWYFGALLIVLILARPLWERRRLKMPHRRDPDASCSGYAICIFSGCRPYLKLYTEALVCRVAETPGPD